MHATRARLPQKRTRSAKPAAKRPARKPVQLQPVEALATSPGVVSLAAKRAVRRQRALPAFELYAQVDWIAPAREGWRRGELEVRRSACMPVTVTALPDGTLSLTELPGQVEPLRLDTGTLSALEARGLAQLQLTLPGLRVTLTAEDLRPALPARRPTAQVFSFPTAAAFRGA